MEGEKDIEKAVPAKAAGADKKPCLDRVLSSKHGVKIIAVGSCLVIAGAIIGVLYATCASGRRLRRNASEAAGPRPIDDRARRTRAPSDARERAPEHATRLRSSAAAVAAAAAAAPRTKATASGSSARPPSELVSGPRARALLRPRLLGSCATSCACLDARAGGPRSARPRSRPRPRATPRRTNSRPPTSPSLPFAQGLLVMALLVIPGAAASDRRARAGSKYPKLAACREALKEPCDHDDDGDAGRRDDDPVVAAGVC